MCNVLAMMSLCLYVTSGRSPAPCGKKRKKRSKQHRKTPSRPAKKKRPRLSRSNILFSRREGRAPVFLAVICLTSGRVAGPCQVEQRSRNPPAYPELNATPRLHEQSQKDKRWGALKRPTRRTRETDKSTRKVEKTKARHICSYVLLRAGRSLSPVSFDRKSLIENLHSRVASRGFLIGQRDGQTE